MQFDLEAMNQKNRTLNKGILPSNLQVIKDPLRGRWKSKWSRLLIPPSKSSTDKKPFAVVNGILQPVASGSEIPYKFQITTDAEIIFLNPSRGFENMFRRHLWERFLIKGTFTASNVLKVKSARVEDEEVPTFHDSSKGFDLDRYCKMIRCGFFLEPEAAEVT